MHKNIKDKIEEIFDATPDDVSVGYGKKMVNGEYTGDLSFIFYVLEKKPLDQLSEDEILPNEIEVEGEVYPTDVIEIFEPDKTLACDADTNSQCYGWLDNFWDADYIPNRITQRPLKGGTSLTYTGGFNQSVGTLGFIAVDSNTDSIVGVTNNHVIIGDAYLATDRDPRGAVTSILNDQNFQTGEPYAPVNATSDFIGKTKRYYPIKPQPYSNKIDAALVAVTGSVIDPNESIKLVDFSYTGSMPFATTEEIDNLLVSGSEAFSTGRSTGAKSADTPCGIQFTALNVTSYVLGYENNMGETTIAKFSECIEFKRLNPECPWPIYGGDSGSALCAKIDGVWKIVGLCFAGGSSRGLANRIDNVASLLQIEAWDGSEKSFSDIESPLTHSISGLSNQPYIDISGSRYWQAGLIKQ